MFNDLPIQVQYEEMERNAYNAAFYELGFRWYWDTDTYNDLLRHSPNATDRVLHYLQTQQAHLLKAYDGAFLAGLIEEKKTFHRRRVTHPGAMSGHYFDWSQAPECELGA